MTANGPVSSLPPACSGIRVWPYADHFLLEPLDGREGTLSITRKDGKAQPGGEPSLSATVGQPFSACVLLGVVDLLSGPYVLLATNSELVGTLHGGHVLLITETKLLRGAASLKSLTSAQRADEEQYVQRLERALAEHGLYYSYNTDITTRTQNRQSNEFEALRKSHGEKPLLWQLADHRLVWNSSLLSPIAGCPQAAPFLVPVVQGSFQFVPGDLNGRSIVVSVIARRTTTRIGTRMWRRGADSLGNVANFVESEQLLQTGDGFCASFVQLRGSIPVHWEQIVDLTYKPKIKTVGAHPGSSLGLHVSLLREEYGSVVALDLVNQKGGEKRIGGEYANTVDHIRSKEEHTQVKHPLTYVAFDFHKVCGHAHFDRVEMLYDQVSKEIAAQGYFLKDPSGKVLSSQHGVVRTNCVDCLDRTNVTQSLVARKALEAQLVRLGVLKPEELVKEHKTFNTAYKIAWANHGDDISRQYSGTGALKGDFVRYGKRSIHGMLQDGRNSLMRYVYNNFYDGVRQDGLDLVMGNYTVRQGKPSPFRKSGLEAYLTFSRAAFILMASAIAAVLSILDGLRGNASSWLLALASVVLFGSVAAALKVYGRIFCDRPKLCPIR